MIAYTYSRYAGSIRNGEFVGRGIIRFVYRLFEIHYVTYMNKREFK